MKKLTIEIIALLIFITAVFIMLEYQYRDYENPIDRIMKEFLAKKKGADVILVGNSHTLPLYYGLKQVGNKNVGCITIGGDDLFWMQALVKRYLHEMDSAKYVILNCDDELLGFNQSLSGMKYMNRILYPYADTMYENNALDKFLSRSNFFRSNRDIGYLFHSSSGESMVATGIGGSISFTDEECRSRAIEISEKRFQRKLFTENLHYIKSIILEARRLGKQLFILKMPKCECLEAYVNKANLEASRTVLDSLFIAEGVEKLDFRNDTTFQRNDFANPDHLTITAAIRLISLINERIFSSEGQRPVQLPDDNDPNK